MAAKVLLVEDDPEQAILFAQVLAVSGYDVTTVANAEEAQARMADSAYALLLVDWDLGSGINGDTLICWAKDHAPDSKTILFSNHTQVDELAAACNADGWFRKIEGAAPLRQLVKRLIPSDGHA